MRCSFALALLAAGCAGPRGADAPPEYRVAEGFAARRPADIAVLPVAGTLPEGAADDLREAVRSRLIGRRYAPVRFKEIADRPGDFAPGGPNAVLLVEVERWDDAALYGTGTLRLTGSLTLYGPGSTEPLYRAALRDAPVPARFVAHRMEDRRRSIGLAAAEAAEILLAHLPLKGDG